MSSPDPAADSPDAFVCPDPYRAFFENPQIPRHRRYEMLRAKFVEGLTAKQIAERFDVRYHSVRTHIRDFKQGIDKAQPMEFFLQPQPGPKTERKKPSAREHIVRLRALGYADTDIYKALKMADETVSVSLIDQVLREEGLAPMRKRTKAERERIKAQIESREIPGLTIPQPAAASIPAVADARQLDLSDGRTLRSRVAGAFLFLPFLAQVGLDAIVNKAQMAGTKMIPAIGYALSLLALKLLDKERKSHIADWNFDEALGWFAGLNVFPKTTATADYSYRLVQTQHNLLLAEWVRAAHPILCPETPAQFALDFHAIAHRGENAGLENHYVPMRGKAIQSIQTCFARAVDNPLLCWADADIIREGQAQAPLRFIEYWKQITGLKPDWLYFDSKFTTYAVLDELRENSVNFITIRRRGTAIVRRIGQRPASDWTNAVIDTPQRRHQHVRYLDDQIKLRDYCGECRQVAVAGLGRAAPTLFLTNNENVTGREVIKRYILRNTIENDLGINVNFFHLDCLASEVRLNVNTDVAMSVLANGCYRWLSQQLRGCEKMEPKQLYRKFVETAGELSVCGDEIVVAFERRSHNPIIAQARLDKDRRPIPWLGGKRLRFEFK